ncbi:MAG: hypothetical protein Q7I99_07930 [Acholeplasmataceae bacterium]|nr:hypothetical protein [Acholeplasmataceae bacterium]
MKKIMIIVLFSFVLMLSSCKIRDMAEKYDDEDYITSNFTQTVWIGKIETPSKVSFRSFSGSDLLTTIASNKSATITIDREITEGRFKVVLITHNDQIIELEDGTYYHQGTSSSARLKILGDNARGWYKIKIE